MKNVNEQGINNILRPKTDDEIMKSALDMLSSNELLKFAIEKLNGKDSQLILAKTAIERGADIKSVTSNLTAVNNVDLIRLLLINSTEITPNTLVFKSLKLGLENEIIQLINDRILDPSQKQLNTLVWAVGFGRAKVVEVILKDKKVDPSKESESIAEALSVAIARGTEISTSLLKILLNDKRIDPSADNNRAIKVAAQFGNEEAVKLLLKDDRVDPSTDSNFALVQAYENKFYNIVKLLLKNTKVADSLTPEEVKKYNNIKLVKESLNK